MLLSFVIVGNDHEAGPAFQSSHASWASPPSEFTAQQNVCAHGKSLLDICHRHEDPAP